MVAGAHVGGPKGAKFPSLARAREFLWQAEQLESVSRKSFWSGQPGWSEFALGRLALRQAERLRLTGSSAEPALLLYVAAARLFLAARSADGGTPAAVGEAEPMQEASEPTGPSHSLFGAGLTAAEQEGALAWLSPHGELELAQLTAPQARDAVRILGTASRFLYRGLSERTRPVQRVIVRRWLRTLALFLLVALAVAVPLAALREKNLALGSKVSVPHPDAAYDPRKLVDGNRNNVGFHTENPPNEVTIDLGSPRLVSRVVVYNRMDCCQERALPIRLELKDDGKFRKVAERTKLFDIWRPAFLPTKTRYVRLISKNKAPFHLAEVEIY